MTKGSNKNLFYGLIIVLCLVLTAAMAEAKNYWSSARRNSVLDICFGDGRFVAVGRFGNIHWSTDGLNWWGAKSTSGGYDYLRAVSHGNGQFIAVGDDGKIVRSIDGKSWVNVTSSITEDLYAISWGQNKWIATGDNAAVYSSTDGINWSGKLYTETGPYPYIGRLKGVRFGNGVWAAIEGSNSRGIYSPDGVTWSRMYTGAGYNERLIFANGIFVAVGTGGPSSYVIRSSNGQNWISEPAPANLSGIAYNPDSATWVAIADNGELYRSTNLVDWTLTASANSGRAVSYGNGTFSVLGNEDVINSTDGINWASKPVVSTTSLKGTCWHKEKFVVVGINGYVGHYDPETYMLTPGTSPISTYWTDVASDGTRCVAINQQGNMISSLDGLSWTNVTPASPTTLYCIEHVMGHFCAVGWEGAVFLSLDGITWAKQMNQISDALYAIATDGTTTIAAGRYNRLYSTSDLQSWTELEDSPETFFDIAYSNGIWVAMGYNGDMYTSNDAGASWTHTATIYGSMPGQLVFADGRFVVISKYYGTVFTSIDGINWTQEGTGIEEAGYLSDIAFGDGRFLIVSEYGEHLVSQRSFRSDIKVSPLKIKFSNTGQVMISATMPYAEGGIFQLEWSNNLIDWFPLAADRSPSPNGLLYQGNHILNQPRWFCRAAHEN